MPRTLYALVLCVCVSALYSTAALAQDCSIPPITTGQKSANIFSPEQEMVLGELTYQRLSGDLRFVKDPELLTYINKIGANLISHLPPTGLKFQFFIIDIPEANAFDVPGGYIFISRKLIGFANSEDELAGVMAHELGHAVVRHGATDFSELLKRVLNVTQVGDRKDIAAKYNLLIERARTKKISQKSEENEQQLQADRVGLFAMVAAGYDPSAFASFFDRLAETKGKTGSWFSDIFGKAKPEQKRLRELIKVTEQLPPQCRDKRQALATDDFLNWQAEVVSRHDTKRAENLPGLLWRKELSPKLRSDISHLAFSPDGKYFLAQDDFNITVIRREPLEIAFQIDAAESYPASFTPDGQYIIVGTKSLRFEKWSVAEKKPVRVRELVVRRDCWEHAFSPDGNYLACLDYGLNLNVIDTQSGKKVWEKKDFYKLTVFELILWIAVELREDEREGTRFFNMEFSPDSHFLLVSRSNQFAFRLTIDGMRVDETDRAVLALDLATLKPISLGGDLKKSTHAPFIFLDDHRILASSVQKVDDGGIFSFPQGKRVATFQMGGRMLQPTANPRYVVVKPLTNAMIGVFDLETAKFVAGINKRDISLWNNFMVSEAISGKIIVSEYSLDRSAQTFQSTIVKTLDLPVGTLDDLSAAEVSDNFQWLAVSSKSRGAMWNLGSGERKVYVRGFRGAIVADDGGAIGDFPTLEPVKHSLVLLKGANGTLDTFQELPDRGARQYGRFLLTRESLDSVAKGGKGEDSGDARSLTENVRFTIRNLFDNKVVFTRDFVKEAPKNFLDTFSGRLILYWTLGSEVGKARLKEDPALAAQAKVLGNKDDDYLIEVIDCFRGKSIGTVLLETGKGSFTIQAGISDGDSLVLTDDNNRVLLYSLADGELHHRFFGSNAALNPSKKQIVVENYPGELTFYDLVTGDIISSLTFKEGAAFIRYSLNGSKLFVLSRDQTAYAIDVTKISHPPVVAAQ
jgi:WD40 repeat protein